MVLQETKATATAPGRRWATPYLSSEVDPERRQDITEKTKQCSATLEEKQEVMGTRGSRNIAGSERAVSVQRCKGGERCRR